MGRDGMIPPIFHKLNPRTLTPVPATIIVAVVDLAAGRRAADQLPGRDDEHRHAGRVPRRLDRRDGAAPARSPTCRAASRCRGYPGDADPVDRRLHLDHQGPARGHDLRVRDLGVGGARSGTSSTASSTPTLGGPTAPEEHAHDAARRLRPGRRAARGGAAPGGDARPLGRTRTWSSARSSPRPWSPGPARVDAEYQAYLDSDGRGGARRRRARGCPATSRATFVVHHARSAPAGLLEVAERARRAR